MTIKAQEEFAATPAAASQHTRSGKQNYFSGCAENPQEDYLRPIERERKRERVCVDYLSRKGHVARPFEGGTSAFVDVVLHWLFGLHLHEPPADKG